MAVVVLGNNVFSMSAAADELAFDKCNVECFMALAGGAATQFVVHNLDGNVIWRAIPVISGQEASGKFGWVKGVRLATVPAGGLLIVTLCTGNA